MGEPRDPGHLRCPICGEGVLVDLAYDELPHDDEFKQDAESREVVAFSCGHQVEAERLSAARRDDPNVERRTAAESAPKPIEP